MKGDIPSEGRFGHTCCVYKKSFIIFGGEKKFNQAFKKRECFNDFRKFDLVNNEWFLINTFGDEIEARRNHTVACVGKIMFLIGGVDVFEKYLNDVTSLNLDNFKST